MAGSTSSGGVEVRAETPEFKRLFDRSSQVEPKLKTALRSRIRTAAQSAADVARRAYQTPGATVSAHPQQTGLRDGLSSGVKVTISTSSSQAGVRISSTGKLAQAWESMRGWRHPVFGNRDVFAGQRGHTTFRPSIFGERDKVRAAVESAMQDAVKSLSGGA